MRGQLLPGLLVGVNVSADCHLFGRYRTIHTCALRIHNGSGSTSATATDINEIDIFVGRLILLSLLVDVPITQLTVPDDNSFTRKPFSFLFLSFCAYLVSGQMVAVRNDTFV